VKAACCSNCQANNPTIPLTRIEGGKIEKLDLCSECARAFQPQTDMVCLACGFTAADLANNATPGCPACYQVFSKSFAEIIACCQQFTRHTGKRPDRSPRDLLISPTAESGDMKRE